MRPTPRRRLRRPGRSRSTFGGHARGSPRPAAKRRKKQKHRLTRHSEPARDVRTAQQFRETHLQIVAVVRPARPARGAYRLGQAMRWGPVHVATVARWQSPGAEVAAARRLGFDLHAAHTSPPESAEPSSAHPSHHPYYSLRVVTADGSQTSRAVSRRADGLSFRQIA